MQYIKKNQHRLEKNMPKENKNHIFKKINWKNQNKLLI